jgi:Rv2632c-like
MTVGDSKERCVGWLSAEVQIMNLNDDWLVSLSVDETDGQTRAEACLVMPDGSQLAGHGLARRNPADREVARIGAQLAAARAFSELAGQLLHAAAAAIEDSTHERAHLYQ